ncbi:MAG TPA: hypothetical protein PK812_09760 [Beijerinckiaceae bacterium]|nr:hypothetical protein [Beijerinckiaceae bacterium]
MPLFDTSEIIITNPQNIPSLPSNAEYGTSGNDYITLSQPKLVFAGAGNDIVFGSTGADTVYGGLGDDIIVGGAGDDKLYGDSGNDRLYAGTGSDSMYGGAGNDRLYVDPNDNTGALVDLANGGSGIDTLVITNATAGSLRLFSVEGIAGAIVHWTETVGGQTIAQSITVEGVEFVEFNGAAIALQNIQPY